MRVDCRKRKIWQVAWSSTALVAIAIAGMYSCASQFTPRRELPDQDAVMSGTECESLACLELKFGEPDYRFKTATKDSCLGYHVKGGGVSYRCSKGSGGWSLSFEYPDTTETIYPCDSPSRSKSFYYHYANAFGVPSVGLDSVHIIVTGNPIQTERLIRFRLGDSSGIMEQPEQSSLWGEMQEFTPNGGGYVKAAEDVTRKQKLRSYRIDVSSLNDILVSKKIDIQGSIKKGRFVHLDGSMIFIASNRAGKLHYAQFDVVPWYNQDYDAFVNSLLTIIKKYSPPEPAE